LVTFFLAKQKKVTSCRATPGGVDVVLLLGIAALDPTYARLPAVLIWLLNDQGQV
jgi:hypothetical protein